MKVCEWTPNYSVGISILDSHHQKLFDIIDELFNLINENAEDKNIIKVLADLLEYTRYHFAEEEEVMEKMRYPALAAHCRLHHDFAQAIEDAYNEAQHSKAIFVALKIANMGLAWLKNHIQTIDHRYYEYMLKKEAEV
jgi:hemerythrin